MNINQQIQSSQLQQNSTPIEVQNVEIKAGKVKSKIGFASMSTSLSLWLLAILLFMLLSSIVSAVVGDSSGDLKGTIVLVVSFGIPIAAIFSFALYRLNTIIKQDLQTINDVFFRKNIQFNLFTAAFLGVIFSGILIYNILSLTVLQDSEMTVETIFNSAIIAGITIGMALFFWSYQGKTTK